MKVITNSSTPRLPPLPTDDIFQFGLPVEALGILIVLSVSSFGFVNRKLSCSDSRITWINGYQRGLLFNSPRSEPSGFLHDKPVGSKQLTREINRLVTT
jgi:hypothetical protein